MEEISEDGVIQGVPVADVREQGCFDKEGQRLGVAFLDDVAGIDLYGRAAGYPGPVTVVQGDADEVVDLAWGRRYVELYGGRGRMTVLADGDHSFSSVPLLEVTLAGIEAAEG